LTKLRLCGILLLGLENTFKGKNIMTKNVLKDIVLPDLDFFQPKEEFLAWLVTRIKGVPVVEVGAGRGALSLALFRKGIQLTAIDLMTRNNPVYPVHQLDAMEFQYADRSIIIMARPCHGDWIAHLIGKVFNVCGCFYYIGLRKNVKTDLQGWLESAELVYKNAGKDKEVVYCINNPDNEESEYQDYYLVNWGLGYYWMRDSGDYWINYNGGKCPKSLKDKVKEGPIRASDFMSLDWKDSDLIKPDEETGWLDRNGRFYGCRYMEHDDVALFIFKSTSDTLMRLGWVRIDAKGDMYPESFRFLGEGIMNRLSAEQRNWLQKNGYLIKDID